MLKIFKNRERAVGNERGIALMIVLAAVTLLTSLATEFAYNTNVNYHLALNEKERLQASFLAESAINLMKLELKLEKEMRAKMQSSPVAGAVQADLTGPLCQQFPLSTGLIRGVFLGQISMDQAMGGDEEGGGEGEETAEPAAFVGGMEKETAKEFLDFEGDFEGTCADESAKFNLNMFFGKNPIQTVMSGFNSYDQAKQMLTNILQRPEYKKLFPKDSNEKIEEIVQNIADWIDQGDRVNEFGATTTGNESSSYPAGLTDYSIKNGKFLTLDELFLVAGVNDDWFRPIRENFTVYGGDKVNVCLASDEMVAALIVQYANSSEKVPNINPGDKTKMANLVSVVQDGCFGVKPDVNQIAAALDSALGVTGSTTSSTTSSSTDSTATSSADGASSSSTTTSGSGFANLITTESRYYSLSGSGFVGNTEVKITSILDTKEAQPTRWRMVYWRVE